ncbi:gas vesicle protein GvpO [Streptomyces sp. ISL-94]|uniref:gas vesicle protein GvpO n=1 Tax=Streptomyces sp. ISL-94 TaxID=2819190 RepID=UPI001BE89880|nr:gas vesicle protein GvpO [Streptomyces sp. ISL-94]MBT2482339.1 gas vesicle protein [Streptomyces sp. ISL-94]
MANTPDGQDKKAGEGQPLRAASVIRAAMQQLSELLAQPAEGVSSCERGEDGDWHLSVEVLELARVPDTVSLLASYEVEVDAEGELIGYRRTRRYERGRADRR